MYNFGLKFYILNLVKNLFFFLFFLLGNSQGKTEKGLFEYYNDYFLIGTIYHGKVLGDDNQNLNQLKEFQITQKEFNTITAENCMKPMYLIDENGNYNFEESDAFVQYARNNGLTIVGHTLVWKNSAPDWFFFNSDGEKASKEVVIQKLQNYIHTVVSRYKGQIKYWDVVNEAVDVFKNKNGKRYAALKSTPWFDILGEDYIKIAFNAAHKADPESKLLYNDYNMYQREKSDFILNLYLNLKKDGIPIHGVGSQCHMFMNHPAIQDVEYWLKKFKKAKIPIHITELDVSVLPNAWKHRGASVEDRFDLAEEFNPYSDTIPEIVLNKQAKRYAKLFKLFIKYSDIIERVTFWGVWDGNSWRNYLPMRGRTDYPLLFDRNFNKKPSYFSIINPLIFK